eukprot:g8038.t1
MVEQEAATPSKPLSSFHVFVLANALRRPILVFASRVGRGKSRDIIDRCDTRGGPTYLPLLLDAAVCSKNPITLDYTAGPGHFSALVGVHRKLEQVPLTDGEGFWRFGTGARITLPSHHPTETSLAHTWKRPSSTCKDMVVADGTGEQIRVAHVRDVHMTEAGEGIAAAMARTAQAKSVAFTKAQEQEIGEIRAEPDTSRDEDDGKINDDDDNSGSDMLLDEDDDVEDDDDDDDDHDSYPHARPGRPRRCFEAPTEAPSGSGNIVYAGPGAALLKERMERAILEATITMHTEPISSLIRAGVSPDLRRRSGTSCLHAAAYAGAVELVKDLVQRGVDLHAEDRLGRRPIDVVPKKHPEVARLLSSAMSTQRLATEARQRDHASAAPQAPTRDSSVFSSDGGNGCGSSHQKPVVLRRVQWRNPLLAYDDGTAVPDVATGVPPLPSLLLPPPPPPPLLPLPPLQFAHSATWPPLAAAATTPPPPPQLRQQDLAVLQGGIWPPLPTSPPTWPQPPTPGQDTTFFPGEIWPPPPPPTLAPPPPPRSPPSPSPPPPTAVSPLPPPPPPPHAVTPCGGGGGGSGDTAVGGGGDGDGGDLGGGGGARVGGGGGGQISPGKKVVSCPGVGGCGHVGGDVGKGGQIPP